MTRGGNSILANNSLWTPFGQCLVNISDIFNLIDLLWSPPTPTPPPSPPREEEVEEGEREEEESLKRNSIVYKKKNEKILEKIVIRTVSYLRALVFTFSTFLFLNEKNSNLKFGFR